MAASYQDMNTFPAQWRGENPIPNLRLTSPWANPYNPDGSYNTAVTFNNEVLINENKRNSKIYQMLGNIGAELKIIDPLSFSLIQLVYRILPFCNCCSIRAVDGRMTGVIPCSPIRAFLPKSL